MILLLIPFIISAILSLYFEKNTIAYKIALISLIIYTAIAGTMITNTPDYDVYRYNFEISYHNMELVWYLLNLFIRFFTDNFTFVTLLVQILSSLCLYFTIKNFEMSDKQSTIAILFYICVPSVMFINLLRQGMALMLFFYACSWLYKGNLKVFLPLSIISVFTHYSIIIVLIIILLFYYIKVDIILPKKFSLYLIIAMGIAQLCVYFNVARYIYYIGARLIPMYTEYLTSKNFFLSEPDFISPIVWINSLIIYLIVLVNLPTKEKKDTIIMLFSSLGMIFNILSNSSYIFDRVGLLFSIVNILMISMYTQQWKYKKIDNKKLMLLTNTFYCVYFVMSYI